MLFDFSAIKHDFYGRIERPVLCLKTMHGAVKETIPNYFDLKGTFRFNDVSEVTFTVPAQFEGVNQQVYEKVVGFSRVSIEPYGDFILINPVIKNEGIKEVKECRAYSMEYALNFKKAEIPAGTYNFYNPVNNKDSIMQIITECAPDWSIGTVDRELIGKWRTFDNTDDNLYSFMMNTLQESYNCLFLFDTKNKKINVMSADNAAQNLPIYLSFDNLLKSVEVTELSEEIVTSLSGYGSGEEVNIRSVNPNGSNYIYNLDYFIGKGDLPPELSDKWESYKNNYDIYRGVFSNLNILSAEKINERILAEAKSYVLKSEYDALNTAYLTAQTQKDVDNEEYKKEIEKLKKDLDKKEAELNTQKAKITSLKEEEKALNKQIEEIIKVCKIKTFFTEEEYVVLSQYFIQDSFTEDTFVIPEYSAAILDSVSSQINPENKAVIKVFGAEKYASNITDIFKQAPDGKFHAYTDKIEEDGEDEKMLNLNEGLQQINGIEMPEDIAYTIEKQQNDEQKRVAIELRGGNLQLQKTVAEKINGQIVNKTVLITGQIVNVDIHYNQDNLDEEITEETPDIRKAQHFTITATLHNAKYDGTPYPNMNLSLTGKTLKEIQFNSIENDTSPLTMEIETATVYCTAGTSHGQKQAVVEELYQYVEESLDKMSFPSYEFKVDSANFLFAKEFAPFKDSLKFGSTINLQLNNEESKRKVIIQPILIEIQINYDDETDFELTFSGKYRSAKPEFKFADLISEMSHTSHTVELNKASYAAYKDSKSGNQVDKLTNSNLDVARNAIINSSNQGMEWNSSGMFLRQMMPNGKHSPEQIGLINNLIAMTDDSWENVKLAIGHFKDKNIGDTWGIVAPNITGTLLAGENLVIENTVFDENGKKIIKQFKVDGTGTWINNASLVLSKEPDHDAGFTGGRIMIDPQYGIAAGNMNLFKMNGTEIIPSFIDEEGKTIYDENEKIETEKGSVYYVPKNTKFWFDVRTGNAFFGGDINGKNIIAQTLNGNAIKDGSIDAGSKLTGDVDAEQIYKNVIAAINEYVKFSKEDGTPIVSMDNAVIDNLTAENFTGNKITANEVQTEGLKANVIDAINASIGEAVISSAKIEKINVDHLTGNLIEAINATIGDAKINKAKIGQLDAEQVTIKDGYITNAMIENLSATKINTGSLKADVMAANSINAINANVGTATINAAKIGDLSANKIKTGILDASKVTVANLNADNITSGKLISDYMQIKDGFITNAMIKDLSAGKILSGSLDTNKVTVHSDDGGFSIVGNTTQWYDKAGKVRMQAGQDAQGEFNFAVFGKDGTTAYFDETGIKAAGVPDNIIVNDMVADNANISAGKLDISSLFDEINNDGSHTIKTNKIYFDDKKQNLEVYLSKLETTAGQNSSGLTELQNSLNKAVEDLQGQIDNSIMTWFYDYEPTSSKLPESEWTTAELKKDHIGDLFYNSKTGYAYRWTEKSGKYSWERILDSDITTALNNAKAAQDTADNKKRVFMGITLPTPPYDEGDVWMQGEAGDIMVCKNPKPADGEYEATDWQIGSKYTDDTIANTAITQIKVEQGRISTLIQNVDTIDGILEEVKTESEQTADHFKWLVKSGTNINDFVITDQLVSSLSKSTLLDEVTGTLEEHSSAIKKNADGISSTVSKVTTATNTANSAKEEADKAVTQVKGTVKEVISQYAIHDSDTDSSGILESSWSSESPGHMNSKFVWTRNKTTYVDTTISPTYSTPVCISGAKGDKGEDAVLLKIDSSRGTSFKNNSISTNLDVTIFYGSKTITNITDLRKNFGNKARLEWQWLFLEQEDYGTILDGDPKIKKDGFQLVVTPDDVDSKVTFRCNLIY